MEDKSKLRWLDPFLAGKELTIINRELIDRITDAKWRKAPAMQP
jgi:hypothetical protein